jgi:hypothetical protein
MTVFLVYFSLLRCEIETTTTTKSLSINLASEHMSGIYIFLTLFSALVCVCVNVADRHGHTGKAIKSLANLQLDTIQMAKKTEKIISHRPTPSLSLERERESRGEPKVDELFSFSLISLIRLCFYFSSPLLVVFFSAQIKCESERKREWQRCGGAARLTKMINE